MRNGESHDERDGVATLLAALLTVLHRRSGHDRLTLRCLAGGTEFTVSADLSADPSFQELTALAEQAVRAGALDADAEPDAVVVLGSGDDAPRIPGWCVAVDPRADPPLSVLSGPDEPGEFADQVRTALLDGQRFPQRPVSLVNLLAENGRARTRGLIGRAAPSLPPRRIDELFAEQVLARPESPAVTCGDVSLNYRQLDVRAERVAQALLASGVRPDHTVAVLRHRGVELIVSLLGILKAGAAYLALDPEDPPQRWAELVADAGAEHVLAEDALAARLPAGLILVDGTAVATDGAGSSRPVRSPDALAYVSYTSGSTGRAKGVGVPHRGVARLLREPDWMEIGPDDVFLELAPVMFDASTIEIWAPLINGASLVVLPGPPTEVDRIGPLVARHGVTVLLVATGLFHQLATQDPALFATLRHLLIGGDVASAPHVRQVMADHPGLTFTNGYGPTENTSFTTCWTSDRMPDAGPVPIGAAIRGTWIAVLDRALRPVPPGVVGELYTGGDGLARGYVGNPAATAERFVANPFAEHSGERMYRTGDLVRLLADGAVEFVGRADRQVKVRGYRVELGHIESALAAHPEVGMAAVVARRDAAGHNRLFGYVTPTGQDQPEDFGLRLRTHLRERLPDHLVPVSITAAEHLPLGRNGKVDYAALPQVRRAPRNIAAEFVAPRTALEDRLAELWADVLDVEPVGVEDDFFALGGHSLLAARLLGAMERDLGEPVAAQLLYLNPTVAGLAEAITATDTRAEILAPSVGSSLEES